MENVAIPIANQMDKEIKRPTLSDPQEWAIVRRIYFDDSKPSVNTEDQIERLERMESKQRNSVKNPR